MISISDYFRLKVMCDIVFELLDPKTVRENKREIAEQLYAEIFLMSEKPCPCS